MKTTTLETLLLDRSLGELSPETLELLDAYLEHDVDAATRAARLSSTIAVARTALSIGCVEVPPAPATAPWRVAAAATRALPPFLPEVLRLAACLLLGAFAGWAGGRWHGADAGAGMSRPFATVSEARLGATPITTPRAVSDDSRVGGFWTAAGLTVPDRAVPRRVTSYRLRWDSPAKLPVVEENQ